MIPTVLVIRFYSCLGEHMSLLLEPEALSFSICWCHKMLVRYDGAPSGLEERKQTRKPRKEIAKHWRFPNHEAQLDWQCTYHPAAAASSIAKSAYPDQEEHRSLQGV